MEKIKYIEQTRNKYYSASDVAMAIAENIKLTDKQRLVFRGKCHQYIIRNLYGAIKRGFIIDFQEPIILSFGNYYLHWTQWSHCFDLLTDKQRANPYVRLLHGLIDYPEAQKEEFDQHFQLLTTSPNN